MTIGTQQAEAFTDDIGDGIGVTAGDRGIARDGAGDIAVDHRGKHMGTDIAAHRFAGERRIVARRLKRRCAVSEAPQLIERLPQQQMHDGIRLAARNHRLQIARRLVVPRCTEARDAQSEIGVTEIRIASERLEETMFCRSGIACCIGRHGLLQPDLRCSLVLIGYVNHAAVHQRRRHHQACTANPVQP
nr:hypothetical protein [Tardiphaga alba]